ncbi:MAG: hypothetical protein KC656_05120 [Myxococcales bacterium]|nr:hypothetical protein [Myxococcales bacterium]
MGSAAEDRLDDVARATARLRAQVTLFPQILVGLLNLAGAAFIPVLTTLGLAELSPWMSGVLLFSGLWIALSTRATARGSLVAPEVGVLGLLLTNLAMTALSPPHVGLPVGGIIVVVCVVVGTLAAPPGSLRWMVLGWRGWAGALLVASEMPRDGIGAFVMFPPMMIALVAYVLSRVTAQLAENERGAVTALHALVETNRSLVAQREAAEQSSRAKSTFLANMSHELRTPLNAIIGYGELVLDEPEDFEPEDVDRIVKAGRHLLALVDDVLDMSRIEAGRMRLDVADVPLDDLFADIHGMVENTPATGVQLRWEVPSLPVVRGDALRIRQVVLNVLGNALKFTREGEVALEVTRLDGRLLVRVDDTGPGIPDDVELFRPFSQGTTQGIKHAGTGLGLAISAQLVRAMGGELAVGGRPGGGTRVDLQLPLRPA